jgi:hypothetical protein
LIEKNIPL